MSSNRRYVYRVAVLTPPSPAAAATILVAQKAHRPRDGSITLFANKIYLRNQVRAITKAEVLHQIDIFKRLILGQRSFFKGPAKVSPDQGQFLQLHSLKGPPRS